MPDQVLINFCLDEIDAWQSGAKATPGQPKSSESYALAMRESIKHLETILAEARAK